MDLGNIVSILLLVFGFGFVIFWHELGHFLAAKWSDVKVEQFAVGFGQALVSWRKGLGFRVGTSKQEYDRRIQRRIEEKRVSQSQLEEQPGSALEQEDRVAAELGLGETEYRLNWIPLGGYVKMLGQDDLYANAEQTHPRAYNMKPIGKRMIIVSAGVIMNMILAAIGFCVLFLIGFRVPPAIVGDMAPGSPAQEAGVHVGDRILYYNEKYQHDFTKIGLNVALSQAGESVPMLVRHPDGKEERLAITPRKPDEDPTGFLSIGIEGPRQLSGPETDKDDVKLKGLVPDEMLAMTQDDVVTAVNGQAVDYKQDFWKFDQALQNSNGAPLELTIKNQKTNQTRALKIQPYFGEFYGGKSLNFAGMQTRVAVLAVQQESTAKDKIKPGDVIVSITNDAHDTLTDLTRQKLMKKLNEYGEQGAKVTMTVLRDGKEIAVPDLIPNMRVAKGRYGLGVQLRPDFQTLVVTDLLPGSSAEKAGIPALAKLVSIDGQPLKNWFDVRNKFAQSSAGQTLKIVALVNGAEKSFDLTLDASDVETAKQMRYGTALPFHEKQDIRHTGNPFTAAAWGVGETRDLILQFYLTIQRMIQGSVSPKNVMGPLGIVGAGTKFAYKGNDWLIWFLSMISANLAVVNFLPIPIVDGGLFVFLVWEKIQGRPLSPRAQSIAQVIGLALILSVFLFVTYQDIARMRGF
jgi:regulator of sigma E protease